MNLTLYGYDVCEDCLNVELEIYLMIDIHKIILSKEDD